MNGRKFINKIMIGLWLTCVMALVHAGTPLWTFTPLTQTTITVAASDTATVRYQVTNQSRKTHTLAMKAIPGVTQITTSGNCPNPFVLGYQQSCILNLSINGSALKGNIQGGPIVCQQGNPNQCYQPSAANSLHITKGPVTNTTTLTTSASQLALSVTGLTEYGVSGTPSSGLARVITITNTGSNTAVNLAVTPPNWPAGTSSSTTCGSTLAASSSCTITITPGVTATSDGTNPCSGGTAPVPGAVQVSADNATTVSSDVVVLGYGCVYQGGYVYAFDDTTPNTGSVGGKVATTSDQAAAYPNGIVWSSNGGSGGGSEGYDLVDTSYDTIPGIDETSTSETGSPGSPNYAAFASFFSSTYTNTNPFTSASFAMCNGISDGSCNTGNILTFYNQFFTNNTQANGGFAPFTASSGPTNITYYAAGLCKQTIARYSDWYLPAICEMGYGGSACGTSGTPTLQNIQSSLIDSSGLSTPAGFYWSSTELSSVPQINAWYQFFASGGGSNQSIRH